MGRDPSGSGRNGPIVINPLMRMCVNSSSDRTKGRTCSGSQTEFGLFAGSIYFHERIDRFTQAGSPDIELTSKSAAVKGMHQGHPFREIFHLIRLQVPDKMPPDGLPGKGLVFGEELLNIILPDVTDTCADGFADPLRGKCLAYRNQRHIFRLATGTPAGGSNSLPHYVNIRRNH